MRVETETKAALEAKGWKVSDVSEFLGLTSEDEAAIARRQAMDAARTSIGAGAGVDNIGQAPVKAAQTS